MTSIKKGIRCFIESETEPAVNCELKYSYTLTCLHSSWSTTRPEKTADVSRRLKWRRLFSQATDPRECRLTLRNLACICLVNHRKCADNRFRKSGYKKIVYYTYKEFLNFKHIKTWKPIHIKNSKVALLGASDGTKPQSIWDQSVTYI